MHSHRPTPFPSCPSLLCPLLCSTSAPSATACSLHVTSWRVSLASPQSGRVSHATRCRALRAASLAWLGGWVLRGLGVSLEVWFLSQARGACCTHCSCGRGCLPSVTQQRDHWTLPLRSCCCAAAHSLHHAPVLSTSLPFILLHCTCMCVCVRAPVRACVRVCACMCVWGLYAAVTLCRTSPLVPPSLPACASTRGERCE